MLQLWLQECISAWVYPCQGGISCSGIMQVHAFINSYVHTCILRLHRLDDAYIRTYMHTIIMMHVYLSYIVCVRDFHTLT